MMMLTPHIWVMDLTSHDPHIPKCLFCEIPSIVAQFQQPETQGCGPCPVRLKKWLEDHGDGPDTIP